MSTTAIHSAMSQKSQLCNTSRACDRLARAGFLLRVAGEYEFANDIPKPIKIQSQTVSRSFCDVVMESIGAPYQPIPIHAIHEKVENNWGSVSRRHVHRAVSYLIAQQELIRERNDYLDLPGYRRPR